MISVSYHYLEVDCDIYIKYYRLMIFCRALLMSAFFGSILVAATMRLAGPDTLLPQLP